MIAISLDDLSLAFGTDVILDGITFSLNEGEKCGIIGVNGAGKSSLFRLITGEYTPERGNIFIARDKTVGILTQNVGFESEKTILEEAENTFSELISMESELETLRVTAENGDMSSASRYSSLHERFMRKGGYEFRSRVRGVLKNLGFPEEFWGIRVSSLSGGQKTRLALSCLLLQDPDILMLDEPTNHLDIESLFWLEEYLRASKKTVLVVSHDRYFLDRVVTKIFEIENTRGKLYSGNYSQYAEQKKVDREIAEKHYKNQQKEIARLEAYIEQQRRWNRERNIIAAESRQKAIDRMEKVERPENLPENIRLKFEQEEDSAGEVLKAKRLSMRYPGKELFKNVSFLIEKGERVFLTGRNGCGKSTLIKMLAGESVPLTGEVELGYRVSVGYYDQENQHLDENNTVLDELWDAYEKMTQTELRSTLALFGFRGEDIEKKVSVLSGGEKARLTLAKLILAKRNLLILDEPTNHLDIGSREALENALEQYKGTLIAVSHDRYFINKLSTRILDFTYGENGALFDYRGGYEEYLAYSRAHLQKEEESTSSAPAPMTEAKEQYLAKKQETANKRKQERRLAQAKADAEKTENRIAEIDEVLNTSDGTDYVLLGKLCEEKEQLEEKLLGLYELLEELEKEN